MIASATDYKNVKSGEGNQDPTLPPLESLKAKATRNRHRRRERMELLIGLKCHQLAWKKQCITGFTTYPLNRGFDLGQKHVHVKFIIIGSHSFRKQKKKKKKESYIAEEELQVYQWLLVLGGIWHAWRYSSEARVCLLMGLLRVSLQIVERLRMWFLYKQSSCLAAS